MERKDGLPKGWVKQYRESDPDASAGQAKGWAVFGQKKVLYYLYSGKNIQEVLLCDTLLLLLTNCCVPLAVV